MLYVGKGNVKGMNMYLYDRHTDKYSLMAAIQTATYHTGSTATDQGLHYARYYQFSRNHGGRTGASLALIILTDGHSNDISKTLSEAQLLKVK